VREAIGLTAFADDDVVEVTDAGGKNAASKAAPSKASPGKTPTSREAAIEPAGVPAG
jgi:hypothetical protein